MKRRILLVEPDYKTKYPPLGLMKISSYHKQRGDYVDFIKGRNLEIAEKSWDRIYVATSFTFYWNETIKTIKYYARHIGDPKKVYVGGVLATLMKDDIELLTGTNVVSGLLDKTNRLDTDSNIVIDHLIPDYQILENTEHIYHLKDSYIGYATRGCPNRCNFCAVNKIEPQFIHYMPLRRQIKGIESVYGTKNDLILLDNNVLASNCFNQIIDEIIELGFYKGAKYNNRKRYLDFNQGLDSRRMTVEKMKRLAETCIDPLRIAFDSIEMKGRYIKCVEMASKCGLTQLSNYVLFNYNDTPRDFYQRLKINIRLNEQYGAHIFSFPMKYIPLNAKDRSYIGPHWNKKMLRGVQCVLLATRGLVSPNRDFFQAAFGHSYEEFLRIISMPEKYIIYRNKHKANGAGEWESVYNRITNKQKRELLEIASAGHVTKRGLKSISSAKMKSLLEHYIK